LKIEKVGEEVETYSAKTPLLGVKIDAIYCSDVDGFFLVYKRH